MSVRPVSAAQAVHDTVVGGVYAGDPRGPPALLGVGAGFLLARRLAETDPVSEFAGRIRCAGGPQRGVGRRIGRPRQRAGGLALGPSRRSGGGGSTEPSLAAAYPDASDHIVVLLHGLGQTERCWQSSPVMTLPASTTCSAPSTTPVLVRYNSGCSVADTGVELAELTGRPLRQLAARSIPESRSSATPWADWSRGAPTRPASSAGHEWARQAQDLVTIGAPHHGSPIASGVRLGSRRSPHRPDESPAQRLPGNGQRRDQGPRRRCRALPGPGRTQRDSACVSAGIRQHFVAAVVTGEPAHPFGVLVGDLVVRVSSASGHTLAPHNVHVLGRRRHFGFLSDPDVVGQVVEWLGDSGSVTSHIGRDLLI